MLNWTAAPNAATYNLYRGASSGTESGTPIATGLTGLTYTDTAATSGSYYYYALALNGSAQVISSSNEAYGNVTSIAAPTNLTAVAGNGQAALSWSAVTGAINYQLIQCTQSGVTVGYPYTTSGTSQTVTGLTNGITYYFTVQANTQSGSSGYSGPVAVMPFAVPSTPVLSGVIGNAQTTLSWTASANATSYNVYRGTAAGGESSTPIASGLTGRSFTDTNGGAGLTNGTTYYYTVKGVNSFASSSPSNEVALTPLAIPAVPTNLAAAAGNAQVALNWSASAGATGYKVYRGTVSHGESATAIATVTGGATTYTNGSLTNGTTYYYYVTAYNGNGETAGSNEASATPLAPPTAPVLLATAGNASVLLQWTASTGASGYTVERSTTNGSGYAALGTTVATTFTDATAANGTTYYYIVVATGAGGSATSNQASATPSQAAADTPVITATAVVPATGATVTVPNASGRFNNTLTVTIATPTPNATITYTLNGGAAQTYTAALSISAAGTTTITASATASGASASGTSTATYIKNVAPTVSLTAPTAAAFHTGDNITLTANAADSDGRVAQVQFLATAGGVSTPLGAASSAPYTILWQNAPAGSYALTAVATDNDGAQTTSAPVNITVSGGVRTGTITCGQTVLGSLGTTDGYSSPLAKGSGYYAQDYTFQGTAGEAVIVSASSAAFDTYLTLFSPTGAVAAQNDDSLGLTSNSQLTYQLPATLPGSGVYTIEVTTAAPAATGPYSVTLTCPASMSLAIPTLSISYDNSGTPTPIANGGTVNYGSTPQGAALTKTFTLTNTGLTDLAITAVTGSGDFAPQGAPLSPVIPPGQSETLAIAFRATSLGTASGSVSIGNNTAGSNPYVVNLTGTATTNTGPASQVTGYAVSPGSVVGGNPVQAMVTLSSPAPTGGVALTFSSANTATVPAPAPYTIPAGQSTYTFSLATNTVASGVNRVQITATGGGSSAQTRLVVAAPGALPNVAITAPASGATITAPGPIPITAAATSPVQNVTINKVEFFEAPVVNGTAGTAVKLGETSVSPYTLTWPNVAVGSYQLTAIATDSNGFPATSAPVSIMVNTQPTATVPVILANGTAITTGTTPAPYSSTTGSVSVTITDTQTGDSLFYTTDGSAPTPNSTPYRGAFVLTSNTTVKAIAIQAGYNGSGIAEADFTISHTGTPPAFPAANITAPTDGAEITAPTNITGTVSSAGTIAYWQLDYQSVGASTWTTLSTGTAAANGTLGKLDTTLLDNGQYTVRLTAVDTYNQASQSTITVVVKGNQKIGYETLTYNDLTVPVAGIPITITRTYDSRNKTGGDFGIGWTLSLSNIKLQKSGGAIGENWIQQQNGTGLSQSFLVYPARPKLITITLPDGTVYDFSASLNPSAQPIAPITNGTIVYTPQPGTKGSLTVLDGSLDVITSGNSGPIQLLDASDLGTATGALDRHQFVLTTRDGTQIQINDSTIDSSSGTPGLQYIRQLSGNQLSFTPTGIANSFNGTVGKSVTINRTNGFITSITDPNGNTLHYNIDGNSNLASFTDRSNNTTTYDYDYQHNLTGIHDAAGDPPLLNVFLPDGRLNYTQDGNGNKVYYYYDQGLDPASSTPTNTGITGIPTSVPSGGEITTDRLGNPTLTKYDSYGNVTSQTRYLVNTTTNTATPVTTTYEFADPNNPDQPTRVYDPLYVAGQTLANGQPSLSHVTDMVYDANGNLLSTTRYHVDANGVQHNITTSTTYNAYGEPLTETDANNIVVATNTYDVSGNVLTTADALNNTTTFTYNYDGSLNNIEDAKGNFTTYGYDHYGPAGNLVTITDALNHATHYTYDSDGNKLTETTTRTNGQGQIETLVTQNLYDSSDRLMRTVSPDGASIQTHYDSNGRKDYMTDPSGNSLRFAYDDLGNLIKTTSADSTKTSSTYDANGQTQTRTDKAGRISGQVYDSLGRVVQSGLLDPVTPVINGVVNFRRDSGNNIVLRSSQYDLSGQEIQSSDENGNRTYHSYDDLGRTIKVVDALGNVKQYQYDNDSRQIGESDANNHIITHTFDNAGRATFIYYPDGTHSQTIYDELWRPISQIDQSQHTSIFVYDALGHLISVSDPMGHVTAYSYDELGNKISQTDAGNHTTTFAYDDMGRQIKSTLPLGQYQTTDYDILGRRVHKSSYSSNGTLSHTTTFSYDSLSSNLLSQTDTLNQSISYTYNPDGTPSTATRGNVVTTYGYDSVRGLLSSVTTQNGSNAAQTITYGYDNTGNKIWMHTPSMGAQNIVYGYDADNRLISVTHPDASHSVTSYTYDKVGNRKTILRGNGVSSTYTYDSLNRLTDIINSAGSSYHYTLYPDGKRASITDSSGTTSYTYDPNGRLLTEIGPNVNNTYGYDAVGNRTSKNGTSFTFDANDRPTGVSFDADGNQTTVNGQTAVYDFEHHLISVGSTNTYTYDADGNRVQTVTSSGTTNYLVDTSLPYASVVEEQDSSNNIIARYDYGDDLIRMDRFQGTGSSTSGAPYYYIFDGLGSTHNLTNASGAVTDTYAYDAYGVGLSATGNGTPNSFLFNAQQFDQGSQAYYLRARYYDQANGRFLSQDRYAGNSEDPITLHKYLYAGDDPTDQIDPSGNSTLVEIGTAIGIGLSVGTFLAKPNFSNTGLLALSVIPGEGFLSVLGRIVGAGKDFLSLVPLAKQAVAGTAQLTSDALHLSEYFGEIGARILGGDSLIKKAQALAYGTIQGLKNVDGVAELPNGKVILGEAKSRLNADLVPEIQQKFGDSFNAIKEVSSRFGKEITSSTIHELTVVYKSVNESGGFVVDEATQLAYLGGKKVTALIDGVEVSIKWVKK